MPISESTSTCSASGIARVVPAVAIEVAQRDVAHRADGRQLAGPQMLTGGEGRQPRDDFVPLVEHDDERALTAVLEQGRFHGDLPAA